MCSNEFDLLEHVFCSRFSQSRASPGLFSLWDPSAFVQSSLWTCTAFIRTALSSFHPRRVVLPHALKNFICSSCDFSPFFIPSILSAMITTKQDQRPKVWSPETALNSCQVQSLGIFSHGSIWVSPSQCNPVQFSLVPLVLLLTGHLIRNSYLVLPLSGHFITSLYLAGQMFKVKTTS